MKHRKRRKERDREGEIKKRTKDEGHKERGHEKRGIEER